MGGVSSCAKETKREAFVMWACVGWVGNVGGRRVGEEEDMVPDVAAELLFGFNFRKRINRTARDS
jgi:hypothetical protein